MKNCVTFEERRLWLVYFSIFFPLLRIASIYCSCLVVCRWDDASICSQVEWRPQMRAMLELMTLFTFHFVFFILSRTSFRTIFFFSVYFHRVSRTKVFFKAAYWFWNFDFIYPRQACSHMCFFSLLSESTTTRWRFGEVRKIGLSKLRVVCVFLSREWVNSAHKTRRDYVTTQFPWARVFA